MSASGSKYAPLLLALFLCACQMNVGTLEVHLVYTSRYSENPISTDVVNTLRVRVEGDDMADQETKVSLVGGRGAVLSDVPVGKNRVLTVEGLDNLGFVKSRGISAPFETEAGNTEIFLFISRVGRFSEPPFNGTVGTDFASRYTTKLPYPSRVFHTATPLPSGEVLIIGGAFKPSPAGYLARVEDSFRDVVRFDTTAGAFFRDADRTDCDNGMLCMKEPRGRARHSSELLPGGTHVVVVGGEPVTSDVARGGEYYSVKTSTFENFVEVGKSRTYHASAALTGSPEGVVIAGGAGTAASDLLDGIEMFAAGTFRPLAPALSEPRSGSVAVAVPDGVLVIGGWNGPDSASARVDYIKFPGGNASVSPFEMKQARAEHSAVLLEDQSGELKVFVCGGLFHDGSNMQIADSCEFVYPERMQSELLDLTVERWGHTAVVLPDGRVLIAGGFYTGEDPLLAKGNALVFNTPVGLTQPWNIAMVSARAGHTATLLPNGMVLLVGGVSSMVGSSPSPASQLYEIFNPPLE